MAETQEITEETHLLDIEVPESCPEQYHAVGSILSKQLTQKWAADVLVPIISGGHAISIRVMDWYCTNWSLAKKYAYRWEDDKTKESRVFYVHQEYKSTLHQQGRPFFDPFRRGKRVYITVDGERHETTLGQLYFWWWATKYKVLESLAHDQRMDEVEAHMAQQHAISRERKRKTGKRKRAALSKPPPVTCVITEMTCKHKFDPGDDN